MHYGIGKATSCSIPLAPDAKGDPEVLMAEVDSSAMEREAEDQGDRNPPARDPKLQHPSSLTPKSPGQVRTPPAPLTRDGIGRASSPQLSPRGAELFGRE